MEDAFIAIVEEARRDESSRYSGARCRMSRANTDLTHRHSLAPECGASGRWCARKRYQVFRDPSSIAIGIVLPVVSILLFGYGLSLDVKNVPVAVVLEDPSPEATELACRLPALALFQRDAS